jgi:uncharacterized flavoprotein (TIGR03862 family)
MHRPPGVRGGTICVDETVSGSDVVAAVDVVVVGAGPAGLMAAEAVAGRGASVVVIDHRRSPGRKLLLAGRSGLNITHDEPTPVLLSRFDGSAARLVRSAVSQFDAAAVRRWCASLGIDTFVGSSGRVFPQEMRAGLLLRAWLNLLATRGVQLRPRTVVQRIEPGAVTTADGLISAQSIVLATGGVTWPTTGSDGSALGLVEAHGIRTVAWAPANTGVRASWTDHLLARHDGAPVKNVAVACGAATARGDVVITRTGLEGGPIYALGAALRSCTGSPAVITIDLRPDMNRARLVERVERMGTSATLSKRCSSGCDLAPAGVALVNEAIAHGWIAKPNTAAELVDAVRCLPIPVQLPTSWARAISSAGGIAGDELDASGMLHRLPGVWCAGEMCDWDAPTGGYLLHGCLATGRLAGEAAAVHAGISDATVQINATAS